MKTTNHIVLLLAICLAVAAATSGCAAKNPPPPPPGVAVIGFVPDYCFWDDYEYVGWYGDAYYYWSPRRVWIVCDPIRVQRANVWIQAHPNWRPQAPLKVQSQPQPQPLVNTDRHPRPMRPPHGRHGLDHDD